MSSDLSRIRILSVDDHPLICQGIAGLLATQADMNLIAQAANGREAIQEFHRHRPDVTLMDLGRSLLGARARSAQRSAGRIYSRSFHALTSRLGKIGHARQRKMERAMGIEPTGKALPELENKRFRANADAKCD